MMRGWLGSALIWLALMVGGGAAGQEFSALARIDAGRSGISARGASVRIDLQLSQPVPWRVFTLDAPRRLVMDFREVDWTGTDLPALLRTDKISAVRAGGLRPGWSRLVADLAAPMTISEAEMQVEPTAGTARLRLRLDPTDDAGFAAEAGAPPDPGWDVLADADTTRAPAPKAVGGTLLVAIDAGHGGVDPGAVHDRVQEADVMLALARDLAEAMARTEDLRAVLTRTDDSFVALEERMSRARLAGAQVFVSLHADALEIGQAAGASIYVLDKKGHDKANQRMSERHGLSDLVRGLDLKGQDDTVAQVLMQMARAQTAPRSLRLREALIEGLAQAGARLNTRPARSDGLAVLMSADIPSVLVETGFLSNPADRAALQSAGGRAPLVAGIIAGLRAYAMGEASLSPLLRR